MMATTGRRFKVVLAGLQSVQRYKNWKNHPFAQLGTDVVVRPLNPEAAQTLILRPLNALGFSFEKTGLILRVLSQSNYHPGLIQIFCHRLIEKLYLKWGNKTSDKIVRTIELSDLQMIESDPNFIEDIRNRFDWTLDLDDRYKVLIYSLVLTEDPTTSRSEREFMALAREWWPDVFEKMDQQSLRAVLDEMDGLGVLVREDEEATRMYRLRSPNLLRLLGTRDQIEDELLRITEHSSPRILNPRNFHSKVDERTFCFGPLTKEQEGQISNAINDDIFGITIISGSSALGLKDVPNQVQNIFSEMEDWNELTLPLQFNTARDRIVDFVKEQLKQRNRKNLFSIIELCYLQDDLDVSKFITNLFESNKRGCTSTSRGHIFLLMDPDHSWSWLSDDRREDTLEHSRINYTELKRWSNGAITNALENMGTFTGAKDKGEEIFSLTLGWHNLIDIGLRSIGKSISKGKKNNIIELWKDQIEVFLEYRVNNRFGFLKEFALGSENASLSRCIEDLFNWGSAESKDSIILTQDIFDYVKGENKDAEEILSDGGHRLRKWLKMHDIAHWSEGNSLIVNPIAKEIFLNTSSLE